MTTDRPPAYPKTQGFQTKTVNQRIAAELGVREEQVKAAVDLLDGGATVPFIARYRKEVTGTLDDIALRHLDERLTYLRELDSRRDAVVESIRSQGKLDDAVLDRLLLAETKARLEDIYLPFKPKRRTKAQIAREAGHEPVADALISDPTTDPAGFDAEQLDGARSILVERFAEDADLVGELREMMWTRGRLTATVRKGKETDGAKFADYFEFSEPFTSVPSHRILAALRGEKEEVLTLAMEPDKFEPEPVRTRTVYEGRIAARFDIADRGRAADTWLLDTVRWAWRTKLQVGLAIDTRMRLRQSAETDAVDVFASNLKDLLLAAPAGSRTTMGLDPGFRTGTKVAIVDATGKVVAFETIYPHKPQGKWNDSLVTLAAMAAKHHVELIAIGNGTASRETDSLAAELISKYPDAKLTKVVVSEAGASVYSASAYGSQELPDLDVSIRGAVSIARRLQDPLAELVKIDPKSIGVGQYQHDVSESMLARSLGAVVEDAVNAVGVDVNTASVPLLSAVSGVAVSLAESIVAHRDLHGPFRNRKALKDVGRLGPKAFEQCAGFLRVSDGDDPLDRSSVHPEAYPVVRRIVERAGLAVREVIGNGAVLRTLTASDFVDERFGLPTVTDILAELEKPGRDPRPEFKTATFAAGVEKVGDLVPGMVLEGVVTNVAAFGAFVDVGVHQDGLVHVSAMSTTFVKDPREVVKSGQVVRVKVMDVDLPRQRIGLSLRLGDEIGGDRSTGKPQPGKTQPGKTQPGKTQPGKTQPGKTQPGTREPRPSTGAKKGTARPSTPEAGSMADALRRAGFGR